MKQCNYKREKYMKIHSPKRIYGWKISTKKLFILIREMEIEPKVIYHYTTIRMTKIKNSGKTKCWRGCGETRSFMHFCRENKTITLENN